MGRGGRGGGGGRSGGGGGFRSGGGHRGGGSSHRGGFSARPPSFGGGFHHHYHVGPRFHRRTTVYVGGRGSLVGAAASIIIVALILIFVAVMSGSNGSSGIQASTVERTPLDASYVDETGYLTDNLGWIGSQYDVEQGMRHFYEETGVQPYLYLTPDVNGSTHPTDSEMYEFANDLYEELFTDEGHVLVIFQEYNSSGDYYSYYLAGKQAKTVIDSEAGEILLDYIDHYYYSDYSEDEMFSLAFSEAADRIMNVTTSPMVYLAMVGGGVVVIVILLIAFKWWKKAKEQKNLEAEQTERILNSDLEDL